MFCQAFAVPFKINNSKIMYMYRYFKAFITIESDNASDTEKAKRRFRELIPADIFVNCDRTPQVDSVTKYNDFLQNCTRRSVYEDTLEKLR